MYGNLLESIFTETLFFVDGMCRRQTRKDVVNGYKLTPVNIISFDRLVYAQISANLLIDLSQNVSIYFGTDSPEIIFLMIIALCYLLNFYESQARKFPCFHRQFLLRKILSSESGEPMFPY